MERRHAKGPSLAIGTIVGALGGAVTGASGGATVSGVPVSAIFSTLLGGSGAILGALAGSVGTSFGEVGLLGSFDVSGWLFNSVSGDLLSSLWGSVGSSLGSVGSIFPTSIPGSVFFSIPPSIGTSDSVVNSAFNSLNSNSVGPAINSLINLF